jgi:hypothetical protein
MGDDDAITYDPLLMHDLIAREHVIILYFHNGSKVLNHVVCAWNVT